MLKITKNGSSINFVDSNNKVLGFDFYHICCETVGFALKHKGVKDPILEINNDLEMEINIEIKECDFTGEFEFKEFNEEDQEARLMLKLTNRKTLEIYNYHNGYYSHGFKFENGSEIIEGRI